MSISKKTMDLILSNKTIQENLKEDVTRAEVYAGPGGVGRGDITDSSLFCVKDYLLKSEKLGPAIKAINLQLPNSILVITMLPDLNVELKPRTSCGCKVGVTPMDQLCAVCLEKYEVELMMNSEDLEEEGLLEIPDSNKISKTKQ